MMHKAVQRTSSATSGPKTELVMD